MVEWLSPSTRQRQYEVAVTCNDFLIWTFHLLHRRMQEKGLVRYVETTFAHKRSLHTSGSTRGRKSKQRTYWSMKKSCTAKRWLCLEVCNPFALPTSHIHFPLKSSQQSQTGGWDPIKPWGFSHGPRTRITRPIRSPRYEVPTLAIVDHHLTPVPSLRQAE